MGQPVRQRLLELGIEKGDRVMLRIANGIEYVVCALAVGRLAAVVVPTMTLLRERVITHDANTSEAKAIICGYELLGEVEAGRDKYTTVRHIISIGGDPDDLKRRRSAQLRRVSRLGERPDRQREGEPGLSCRGVLHVGHHGAAQRGHH